MDKAFSLTLQSRSDIKLTNRGEQIFDKWKEKNKRGKVLSKFMLL